MTGFSDQPVSTSPDASAAWPEEFLGWRFTRGWVLVALGLLMLLPGTATLPLMDRDEPRFAQATQEMIDRSEWVVPYFNGEYRFDKPPLTYWWMRLHYAVLGRGELGARLHSVFSALGCALVLFGFGSRLFNRRIGWWAGALWLTTLQVLVHGRMTLADMPMVLAVFLSFWALWELLASLEAADARHRRKWWWIFWLAQAIGFYAKGPIALLVPLLALVLWRWPLGRQPRAWGRLRPLSGLALYLGLLALWGIPALLATQGAFADEGLGRHVVERGVTPFNERLFLPFYYLGTIWLSLFPWSVFLPVALFWARRHWNERTALLTAWGIAPLLIFALYQTQLPHYILPGFGGFLLLIAATLDDPAWRKKWAPLRWGLWSLIGLVGSALAGVAVWTLTTGPSNLSPLALAALGLGCVILSLTLLGWALWGRHLRWALGMVLVYAVTISFAAHHLRSVAASPRVMAMLEAQTSALDPAEKWTAPAQAATFKYAEPSLVFYGQRRWTFARRMEQTGAWLASPPAPVVVWQAAETAPEALLGFTDAAPRATPVPAGWEAQYTLLETVEGWNLARSTWVTLQVWHAKGPEAPQ